MNYTNAINVAFSNKMFFTRNELKEFIMAQKPQLKESTYGWIIYNLCQKRIIQRVTHNVYQIFAEGAILESYNPDLSDDATEILGFLKGKYPQLAFIIWETRAFNEFTNHQLARNFVFVEAEKLICESVFNTLQGQNTHMTLYKPNEKEITLYSGDVTVSILPITSEAPVNGYYARIEKLLVDLFANKLLDGIISRSEYAGIFEESFSKYYINYSLLLRYAKRRNKADEIKQFIDKKTNITIGKEKK